MCGIITVFSKKGKVDVHGCDRALNRIREQEENRRINRSVAQRSKQTVKVPRHGRVLLIYPNMISEAHMTLAMLAAIIQKEGFQASILVNAFRRPLEIADYIYAAKEFKADAVGISIFTLNVLYTYQIIRDLKQEGFFVLAGGPHATDCPEEVVNNGADIVVRGEGEMTLQELCKYWNGEAGLSLATIKGIAYRGNEGEVCLTKSRPRMKSLDQLPTPSLDLHDINLFRQPDGLIKGFHRVFTSRGCPGRCTFCDWKIFGQRMAYYSIPVVVDEIKRRAAKYGIRSFTINDDCFTVNKKRVMEFCNLISQIRPKLSWRVSSRANLVNQQMLNAMKESGCHLITFGLESGDPETLRRINKGVTLEENINVPNMAAEEGLEVYANLMIGFPWETVSSVDNNIQLIRETEDSVYLYQVSGSLVPFPGTVIYEQFSDIHGFGEYWLDESYQHVGIQTYQNSAAPFAISTFYQRHLFDDTYIQSDVFFKYASEYKDKVREMVLKIGKHNLKTLYSDSAFKRLTILSMARGSMGLYRIWPEFEKKVGGFLFNLQKGKRPKVERRLDETRGFLLEPKRDLDKK